MIDWYEWMPWLMFASVFIVLMLGYPVAFSLGGTALAFAWIGTQADLFDIAFLHALPSRVYGIIGNQGLIAVPLFVFMGITLERARIADELLETMGQLFARVRGGLAISVTLVGMLLAASTGIVGATVVTMGLLSLPTLLRHGYSPSLACGTICASGTLGQIIPPSIVLILLGDVLSSAYQQAQLDMGIFNPKSISVGDLFAGALLPGLLLVSLYIAYLLLVAWFKPALAPDPPPSATHNDGNNRGLGWRVLHALIPPLLLILAVLGSILAGYATSVEAASIGAVGALILAMLRGALTLNRLQNIMQSTLKVSSMVFLILIGASIFSLVFRGFEGDELVAETLAAVGTSPWHALAVVMLVMFLLGFVLDFIEITFVVVPLVGPTLLAMGMDPIWLGVLIAMNLQTSFLTPPFGFALFYLRGVAPPEVKTGQIYAGVMPYIGLQLFAIGLVAAWPAIATWLPTLIYGD